MDTLGGKMSKNKDDSLHDTYTSERTNHYGLQIFSRTKDEFINFYKNELENKIVELEKVRKEKWSQLKTLLLIIIVSWLILVYLFYIDETTEPFLKYIMLFNLFVFPLGFSALRYTKWKNSIEAEIKESIMPKMVHFMNPNFTYDPEAHISQETFNDMYLFKHRADHVSGDDLIEGFVFDEKEKAQTNVTYSEVVALNMNKVINKKGKKQKALKLLTLGLFFKVDFNKDFGQSITIVKPRWVLKKRKFRKKLAAYGKGTPLEEVHLENSEFMNEFIVHSNDQINARVIFQADTMQNLLDFVQHRADTLSGEKPKKRKRQHYIPYFTFRENKIYVMIHTLRNHFSVQLSKPLSIETAYDYFKDINRVLRLIDDLYLNLDLYKSK